MRYKITSLFVLSLGLMACSGDSLDSDTDQPTPNVLVNAGPDQSVNEQTTVVLTAEAVGQTDALTYSWQVTPALELTQADSAAPDISFNTPITVSNVVYTFVLTVEDGQGNQGSDTLQLTVLPVNEPPIANISVSSPSALDVSAIPAGIEVILSATGSSDVDASDTNTPISAWRWQQTAGTDVLSGVSLDGDTIAFTTPIEDENNTLTFSLTVTDDEGAEGNAEVDLGVLSASNTVPTVNAGVDHQVFPGELILLNGVASSTIPAAAPLQFTWLNDSELNPSINNVNSVQTFAIAPAVDSMQTVTFTLEVTDSFGNNVDDSVTISIRPLPITPVNDTGVALQADATSVGTSHQGDYPGQDAQRGPDIIATNNLLEKAGRGEQGFDFTRLDEIGDEVDDTSLNWRCVRDNVTGLVWEVKTTDGGLHSAEYDYAWLQTENNGGDGGVITAPGASCAAGVTACNTRDFITAVNSEGLCNFNDWRLPTHQELLSIVHYGRTASPLVDLDYFPNVASGATGSLFYWTSIPSVDGAVDVALNAWVLDFATGNDNFLTKDSVARVRLVRGGR